METAFDYEDPLAQGSLIKAAYAGDLRELKRLIEKGYSANANNNKGYTALHVAAEKEE